VEQPARQHREAAAITDLDSAEVSESQLALVEEVRGIPAWKAAAGATDPVE